MVVHMFIPFLTVFILSLYSGKINLSNILFLMLYFGSNSEKIIVKMNIIIINE